MKISMVASLVAIVVLSVPLSATRAEVPGLINHQGYLTDDAGVPVTGDVEVAFSIHHDETEPGELWSEGPMTVTVSGGVYNMILGQITPITPGLFTVPMPLWLEVTVGGEALSPRERLVSVPYAIVADNADTVDGMHGAALEESAEIDADIAAHAAAPSAHHSRYTDAEAVSAAAAAGMEESAEIDSDIAAHAAVASAHHAKTESFSELTDAATDAQVPDDITVNYAAAAGDADTVDGEHAAAFADASYVAALEARIAALEALLAGVTRDGNDITFSGANVHIVNGSGSTDSAVNGFGNLIVGYNELRGEGDDRTGSHNVVVGMNHNYSSFSGLVVGEHNSIAGRGACVSGGFYNQAIYPHSSVSGGHYNVANHNYASVSGGWNNQADGEHSSVSGGAGNMTTGWASSIIGGSYAEASGGEQTIIGDAGKVYVDGDMVH